MELSRRAQVESLLGSDLPKDWKFGHPDASEEVFNTYLGFLDSLTEYDGSDHGHGSFLPTFTEILIYSG